MAAAMWGSRWYCSGLTLQAADKLNGFVQRSEHLHIASLLRACLTCARAHVMSSERNFLVTSRTTCLWNTPVQQHAVAAGGSCCRKIHAGESEHSSNSSFSSSGHRFLFPLKRKLILQHTMSMDRFLDLRTTLLQIESRTNRTNERQLYTKSCNQCSDANAKKDRDKMMCSSNAKPEKKENIKTIPNLLTTVRMASAPMLGCLVVNGSFGWALSLFAIAGITDLLDGYIARNFPNQTSALGSALDPLADKLLVTILTISMTSVGLIPLPLTGLIVFRDVSLIAGGFYIRYRSLPPPITLSRYFDISHATVSLTPTFISKLNTGLQLSLVACSLAAPVFGFVDHPCLQVLWWTTGATTFLSGADYFWSWKKYVKLLEKDQKEL